MRPRGRINPVNLEAKHAIRAERHAEIHAELRRIADGPLPATFDCLQYVTPIKSQASCGSCWDFSGVAVVESANIKAGNLPDNSQASWLSEQYLLDDCAGENGGCGGDDNTTVLGVAKSGGLPLTSAYGPYQGQAGSCVWQPQSARVRSRIAPPLATGVLLYTLSDWGYVSSQSGVADTNLIKAAMMKYGLIGSGIAADAAFENWGDNNPSKSSPFTGSGGIKIDHDIDLAAWDDSAQAWLLRNSWDVTWGINGYMWIAYGANRVGTEAVWGLAGKPVPYMPPAPGPSPTPGPGPTRRAADLLTRAADLLQAKPDLSPLFHELLDQGENAIARLEEKYRG